MYVEKVPPCKLVSSADLARITGYTEVHLSRLAKEGMPKAGRGRYDIELVVKWLLTRRLDKANETMQDAKKRLIEEQIESQKLENERSRGELVPIEEVQHALNHQAVTVATQLDGLAPRVAYELSAITQIPAPKVQEVVFRECRAIRETIASNWQNYHGADAHGGDDSEAAAKPNRGRVGRPRKVPAAGEPRAGQVA